MKKPSDEILESVLQGKATKEQTGSVAYWFSTPDGLKYLSQRIENDKSSPSFDILNSDNISQTKMIEELHQKILIRKLRRRLLRVAAVLIPFIFVASSFVYIDNRVGLFTDTEYCEFKVPKGERLYFAFQDGTTAYINSGSTIRYPRQFAIKERKIFLEGEAFFNVAQNASRPFLVKTDKLDVCVKGTTFNVKAYPEDNNIVVHLYSGIVELNNQYLSHRLKPNDVATYNLITQKMSIVSMSDDGSTPDWINSTLKFYDAPLNDVLSELSKVYNVKFKVSDASLYKYQFTLTSTSTTLERVLDDLCRVAPIKIIRTSDVIELKHNKQ